MEEHGDSRDDDSYLSRSVQFSNTVTIPRGQVHHGALVKEEANNNLRHGHGYTG